MPRPRGFGPPICFRLPTTSHDDFELIAEQFGISVGTMARDLVERCLAEYAGALIALEDSDG